MSGTDTAAMVPNRFDIVIDGYGYVTARAVDPNLPFRTQEVAFSYTPTFLERTNVGGAYGDNQQDFFLTASQHDWSEGEDQKFYKSSDPDSVRRYWLGSNVDITVPGQVSLRPAIATVSLAATVSNAVGMALGSFFVASSTNVYEISTTGTVTDRGAHGAGGGGDAICSDGLSVFVSGSGASAIRRYNPSAHTFAAFATAAGGRTLAFLNNTLWDTGGLSGALNYFDSSGNANTAFSWLTATGASGALPLRITPFGSKIAALLYPFTNGSGAEIWIGDTTGASRVARFPQSFAPSNITEANGILFIAGVETNATFGCRTVIYYFQGGTCDRLWSSQNWYSALATAWVGIAPYQNGLIFNDVANSAIRYYDFPTGGASVIGSYTPNALDVFFAVNDKAALMTQGTANVLLISSSAAVATTGYIRSSLIDFENSLTKLMRGIKVDYSPGTDGNGGSVDISYQLDSVDGAYTSLQVGATSGTEYALSTNAHSISVQITLNKGTSTFGPTLKRVYVRGVPVLQAYRLNSFILDLGGVVGKNLIKLRDGSQTTVDGETMRGRLQTAITAQTPLTITDRSGTYTGILEPSGCEFDQTSPGEWYAQVKIREV